MIIFAEETYLLFQNMIYEEYKLRNVAVQKNEEMYLITYELNEERKSARFPLEAIDCFLDQMNREPEKYK